MEKEKTVRHAEKRNLHENNKATDARKEGDFTQVKNAHAAGDGALKKNDENLRNTEPKKSGENY